MLAAAASVMASTDGGGCSTSRNMGVLNALPAAAQAEGVNRCVWRRDGGDGCTCAPCSAALRQRSQCLPSSSLLLLLLQQHSVNLTLLVHHWLPPGAHLQDGIQCCHVDMISMINKMKHISDIFKLFDNMEPCQHLLRLLPKSSR
jgi:hypothetical protein